jgi:hypothetical protein
MTIEIRELLGKWKSVAASTIKISINEKQILEKTIQK